MNIDKLKIYIDTQQWDKALALAAKVCNLKEFKVDISRGNAAVKSPIFYKQIGQDPQQLIETGIKALKEFYEFISNTK